MTEPFKPRRKLKNYWGHRYFDVGAPSQQPTAEGYGLTPQIVEAVNQWKSARTRFVAGWGIAVVLLATLAVFRGWGYAGIRVEVVFGWIPMCFVLGFLSTRYGAHPEEAQVKVFERAQDRWLRFGRPLSEHKRLVRPWTQLSGHGFEHAVTRIFRGHRLDARTTRGSGDGGIDIEIFMKGKLYAVVQCKRYKTACGPAVVRERYGAMQHRRAPHAMLICLGGFTSAVEQFARGKPISLIDSKALLQIRDGDARHLLSTLHRSD